MKIVQILNFDEGLLGLTADGDVYEYYAPSKPQRYLAAPRDLDQTPRYMDGHTGGWRLLTSSTTIDKLVPHSEDPTRAERS